VIAQHVDPYEAGPRTGFFVPEAVRIMGGRGSLVNHSEHRLPPALVERAVSMLRGLDLVAIVCARDAADASRLARHRPPYLAVEPPELIGTGRSVSRARPEVIEATVRRVHAVSPATHVLCGAGVVTRDDVRRALELGAEGVLVASAVAASSDPVHALRELLGGFPRR
jgi:triosephosphate isomerase